MFATCRSYHDPPRDAEQCFELGKMRTTGTGGLARDPAAAFWLFSRSCDFGYAEGCIMTGVHFELGRGLPGGATANQASAATYYDLACKSDPSLCGASAIDSYRQFVRSGDLH
jgi:TPR repeat protein